MEHNSTKGTLMSGLLSDNCMAFVRIMSVFINVLLSAVLTAKNSNSQNLSNVHLKTSFLLFCIDLSCNVA